ncbi:hypothetical protein Y017_06680 [Alcanivorax sp. 97CO-5]|nr:hypothetical protein Y017_06680 [Alcanivorax sp. 97CO-5]
MCIIGFSRISLKAGQYQVLWLFLILRLRKINTFFDNALTE